MALTLYTVITLIIIITNINASIVNIFLTKGKLKKKCLMLLYGSK